MATATKSKSDKDNKKKATAKKVSVAKNVIKTEPKKNNIAVTKSVVLAKEVPVKKTAKNTIEKVSKKDKIKETDVYSNIFKIKKVVKKEKIKVEEITDADLVGYSLEELLVNAYGEIGTTKRDLADIEIKKIVVRLVSDSKAKSETKTEPKTELKQTVNDGNRILPIGYELESNAIGAMSEEKTTTEKRPINLEKQFVISKGASFLKGDVKISADDTKIVRLNELNYTIYGDIGMPTAFVIPFPSIDLADAEKFWDELTEYETNPEKYTLLDIENNAVDTIENSEPDKSVSLSEAEKAATIKKFEGLPLTEVNIEELINVAPSNPIESVIKKTLGKPADVSQILNNQMITQMDTYGVSVLEAINERPWNPKSSTDVNRLLSNQVSREYEYLLKNDGQGYYIDMSKNGIKVRIPKDAKEFLNMA